MSTTEFVGIELQLRGYDGVMSDMRTMDGMLKSFRGQKNKIMLQDNLAEAKKRIIACRGELEKLSREQRDLRKTASDAASALTKAYEQMNRAASDMVRAQSELNRATSNLAKAPAELDTAVKNLASSTHEMNEAYSKLSKSRSHSDYKEYVESKKRVDECTQAYNKAKTSVDEYTQAHNKAKTNVEECTQAYNNAKTNVDECTQAYNNASSALEHNRQAISDTKDEMRDMQQASRELQYALKNFSQASFTQNFKKISAAMSHIGGAMQSAGNALIHFSQPFQQFTSGIVMGAGYKALNAFSSGLESGFDRYDTMKKFPKILAQYGATAKETDKVINKLNDSVDGLPVALDDAISMAQRFIATTGDITKGTDLAIAANNAFLASMSTETQRYQGMMQLQDVIGGKDMNAKEWNALAASMMPAIRQMGIYLGKTGKELDEYVENVRTGKIANKEFVDTLIKAGTDKKGSIYKMAQEAKDTWEAFFSRIGTAASRMVYGILLSLDEISQTVTGMDVNQLLDEIVIPSIDEATEAIKAWIQAHPDEIIDFFKSLKEIDIKGFLKGFAEGMGSVLKLATKLTDVLGNKGFERLGKLMAYSGFIGRALMIGGGLIKGSRHPFAGLLAAIVELSKLFTSAKNIEEKGGIKGLAQTILGGKQGESVAETVNETKQATNAIPKTVSGLTKVFKGWGQLATMVGGTALVGFGTFKAFKSMMKDLGEMVNIAKGIDWKTGTAVLTAMGGFITTFIAVGSKIGGKIGVKGLGGASILGGITMIFSGSFWADMEMIKQGFEAFSDTVGYMLNAIDGLKQIKNVEGIGNVISNLRSAVSQFNEVISVIQVDHINPMTGTEIESGGLKRLSDTAVKSVQNISEALTAIGNAIDSLNVLKDKKVKKINFEKIRTKLQDALTEMSLLLIDLPPIFKSSQSQAWTENVNVAVGNIKSVLESIGGEGGILSQIPKITQRMQSLNRHGNLDSLKAQMEHLGEVLTSAYTSLQGIGYGNLITENIQSFVEGLIQVRRAIYHLNKIAEIEVNDMGYKKIKQVIKKLNKAFDPAQIDELKGKVESFVATIKEALQTLKDLNENIEVDVKVSLSPGFQNSVDTVVDSIKKAKNSIKDLNKKINLTIPVNVKFTVKSNLMSALDNISNQRKTIVARGGRIPVATGGYITKSGVQYRSGGGSVFKPRGTDTVPAMLTPGEYVHSKKAVDTFGLDFMKRVNNLDIRGAMDTLMRKASGMANVSRQTVINNTYNNNQRLTQNISTNSPAFTIKNASRFVGAF